MGGSFTIMPFD